MPDPEEKVTGAFCSQCGQQTKHHVLAFRRLSGREGGEDEHGCPLFEWGATYEMLECCGCESIVLRRTYASSDDPEDQITYFPPVVSRRFPIWLRRLSWEMQSLLGEVYAALHADSRWLAMMGARTLIDMVMRDKIGDAGTFKQRLDGLVARGVISPVNREVLEAALEAGNAATHRGHRADAEELNSVMDIVENLLQAVYVLEPAALRLRQSTPPRSPAKPASTPPPPPAPSTGCP